VNPAANTRPVGAPNLDRKREMGFGAFWAFLAVTFGLTWGLAVVFMLFTTQLEAIFGEVSPSNPLFILAVYAPGIAGVSLVLRHYGLGGLGAYLRRLTLWRMSGAWWAFLVLGIPALVYASAALSGTIGEPFPFTPWQAVLPAIASAMLLGPIEEFGWRGVALPLLQRRMAPLWAGLVLGAIWGLWHVPAFLLGGTPQSAWSFAPYFIGVVTISVILTPLFNASRGSILIAALYHFQINNPIFPDAQPWDTVAFVVAAVVIVVLNRKALLSREAAVTEVLVR
jgi:membrane protease YdiL (CAAX protease family)